MKLSIKISMMTLVLASLAAIGCSSPCGDLETQCGNCTEATQTIAKAACDATVKLDDSDACQLVIDAKTYETACPAK
jgi:hypothetical protein